MDVEVIEDAVDPLSQSLSVARLELRLRPGNESTDSPLETEEQHAKTKPGITNIYKPRTRYAVIRCGR